MMKESSTYTIFTIQIEFFTIEQLSAHIKEKTDKTLKEKTHNIKKFQLTSCRMKKS